MLVTTSSFSWPQPGGCFWTGLICLAWSACACPSWLCAQPVSQAGGQPWQTLLSHPSRGWAGTARGSHGLGPCRCCRVPAQPLPVPAHCSLGSHVGVMEMLTETSAAKHRLFSQSTSTTNFRANIRKCIKGSQQHKLFFLQCWQAAAHSRNTSCKGCLMMGGGEGKGFGHNHRC